MADSASVRQRIIASVFSKLNAAGHQETYASHVKIWEDVPSEEGGRKPRYIILARSSDGNGFIHKSKLNSNGTFSVGKTWRLQELRGIEVINPLAFNITFARTYRWQTENEQEQASFIVALVRLFRSVTGGAPLQLAGFRDPDAPLSRQPPPREPFVRMERAPTPPNGVPLVPTTATPKRPYANGRTDGASSGRSGDRGNPTAPTAPLRSGSRPRRPPSPIDIRSESPDLSSAYTATAPDRSSIPTPRTRPGTPSSQGQLPPPSALRPRPGRRPSNASSTVSSTMRSSAATASSQIPSIALPVSPSRSAFASTPVESSFAAPTPVSAIPIAPAPKSSRRANGAPVITSGSLDVPFASSSSASSSLAAPSPVSAYPHTPETARPRNLSSSPGMRTRQLSTGPDGPSNSQTRREPNSRVSFFDPANQAVLDRLLSGDIALQDYKEEGGEEGTEVGEETAQAMLTSVEEMLEGYEWASGDFMAGTPRGTTDQVEARLMDELMALEKANIHSFIESDDRVNLVIKFLEDAISELDGMDSIIASYKIHLNAVNEDITFIQSQDRGLQVQTQNQRTLLGEIEDLIQTVQVDREALLILTQESLEKSPDRLEEAAAQLYKALQAGRDRDMAATMERLEEYKTYNAQFCKRLYDFLSIMCTAQAKMILGDTNGLIIPARGRPTIRDHKLLETYLERFAGLMFYLKEMDESVYGKLCAAYFSTASDLHMTQIKAFMTACSNYIKRGIDEDDGGFGGATPTGPTGRAAAGVKRAGTIVRSPLEGRKERKEQNDGNMKASDAFTLVLERIAPLVYEEQSFINWFLRIDDSSQTFADHMNLENYFRRQAQRAAGLSPATVKLLRGAMDLIFGFLPLELKAWLDAALAKDHLHIIGMIVCLERFLLEAEERGSAFFIGLLEKQHVRLKGLFERRVAEHIKSVEDTKLTSKKRNGVAPFIKYFPTYVGRVETQLIGADTLEIRHNVDVSYERIVQAMFAALKQMAKMDGEGEDKGQLNYHVILIENMHHFVAEMAQLNIGSVAVFLQKAQAIYDENLNAYVKIVLRRPFSKIIEYFEGVERLLKTTAPSEVSSNSSYSKSALKKVIKEYDAKDVRKHVDALFKRVEKHFTEASEKATSQEVSSSTGIAPGTVMVGVWKACEEELLRITELFAKRIAQCYASTSVTLEYSAGDVEAAFKRHRVGA